MDQPEELSALLEMIKQISGDILVYTGYQLEELQVKEDPSTQHILKTISVLIDGPYIEEQNDNSFLRGSSNQQIHILDSAYEEQYRKYTRSVHNQIQNFVTKDGIVSVGIHRRTF